MNRISITKSRSAHYTLTVRDSDGRVLLIDKFNTLEAARVAAAPYRMPS
jgi:hypothetical protein